MTDQVKDEEVKQDNKEPQENKQQTQEPQTQENEPQDDPVEKNWKAVREKQKEEERKRQEHERKIAEQQEMIKALEKVINTQGNAQGQTQPQTNSNGVEIHPNEWVTGEQLEKIREQDRKQYDEIRKKEEAYRQQMEMQQKLNNNYPDYKDVLNQDNLAYLEYHEPEIAASIQQIQDPYLQVAAAYKNVKAFVPQMHERDKAKMERTQNAPGSLSDPRLNNHTNQNATMQPNSKRLSKQRQQELWKEMLESSR
jgi:hypothetical protein